MFDKAISLEGIPKREYNFKSLSFFFDDGESLSIKKKKRPPDIQLFAGFGIDWANHNQLIKKYYLLKESFNIPHYVPLKYNMRDNKVEDAFLKIMIRDKYLEFMNDNTDSIRENILRLLYEHSAFIIGSGRKGPKSENGYPLITKDIKIQAFENLIQRLAYLTHHNLHTGYSPKTCVISETPSSDTVKELPKCYNAMFNTGYGLSENPVTVFGSNTATPLRELKFNNNLIIKKLTEEPLLEIADHIAGMIRDLIDYCFDKDKKAGIRVEPYFKRLDMLFHKDPEYKNKFNIKYKNDAIGVGLVLSPKELYELLDDKYTELLH
ncbi:MAG TPA: hypothetical protein VMX35_10895 [Acidobacteriota bacterium]|nr:hypothetical protein [Acidobacteriota bacterium]